MTKNLELWESWADVPENAQKVITAGRLKGMTDISPIWRYRVLTEKYGPCGFGWYTDEEKYELHEGSKEQIVATCTLKLYVKDQSSGEWSKGITGQGGAMFINLETKGLYTNDEAFKMAYTDAVSVACKQLGIGANIYWSRGVDTKYGMPEQQSRTDDDPLGELYCSVCGADIAMGPYKATMKQFGKALCPSCIKKEFANRGE